MGLRATLLALCVGAACAQQEVKQFGTGIGDILDKMFTSYDETFACTRVLSVDGGTGCGSRDDGAAPAGGVMVEVEDEAALDALVANPPGVGAVAILIGDKKLTGAVLRKALALDEKIPVNALVVLAGEGGENLPPGNVLPQSTFNAAGSGELDLFVPFPVVYARREEDVASLREKAAKNVEMGFEAAPWSYAVRGPNYQGRSEEVDSIECLNKGFCNEVGGYSVWSTIGAPVQKGQEKVLITAKMDARALFPDLAHGHNGAASGIAAVLLAARALGELEPALIEALPKQLAVALFGGEEFGRVGSRRFVHDISLKNGCEKYLDGYQYTACESPRVFANEWERLRLQDFGSVIAVDQVAVGTGAGTTYHTHVVPGSDASAALEALATAQAAAAGLEVQTSTVTTELPPTSLDSFLEGTTMDGEPWAGTGIVLSGYDKDYTDTNPMYGTRFDTSAGPGAEENATAVRIAGVATLLARTAFVEAGGAEADLDAIQVDEEHAVELWGCLVNDFVCPLALKTLNNETAERLEFGVRAATQATRLNDAGRGVPLHAADYTAFAVETTVDRTLQGLGVPLISWFSRLYLVRHTMFGKWAEAPEVEDDACTRDWDCAQGLTNTSTFTCATGRSSSVCLDKQCRCPYSFYHDASSPDLVKDDQNVVSLKEGSTDKLYARFNRNRAVTLTVYTTAYASATTVAMLVTGLVSTVATGLCMRRVATKLSGSRLKLD